MTLNLENLEDLAASNLDIKTTYMYKSLLNTTTEDAVFGKLFKKQSLVSNVSEAVAKIASERKSAMMLSEKYCLMFWSEVKKAY